MIIDWQQICFT